MAFPVPPLDSSILAYNPYFPNGVVSGDWATYFTALQNTLVSGPVTSFNGRFGVVTPQAGDYSTSQITNFQDYTPYNAVKDYGADNTGATNSTTALLNFFNACIANNHSGYIPAGTYKVTTGVLKFDTPFVDAQWPTIYTDGYEVTIFSVDPATATNAPVLQWTNGTATSPAGKYWRGGYFGGITINDTTGATAASRHGISLRGVWGTRFGYVVGNGIPGNMIEIEPLLYTGSNPDPYAVTACYFEGIEANNGNGWAFKNENYVGFNLCTIHFLRAINQVGGGFYGCGAGNTIDEVSIGSCQGWAIDDGGFADHTGGQASRFDIGFAELDNVQNGIRLNSIYDASFQHIRFVHRFNVTPNVSGGYWPRTAVDFCGGTSPSVQQIDASFIHRIEAGGTKPDLGVFYDFSNNGNTVNAQIDYYPIDNAGLGLVDSDFYTNTNNAVFVISNRGRITNSTNPLYSNTQVLFGTTNGLLTQNANFTYVAGSGVRISDATASSSTVTGAAVITGGMGVGGSVYVGGTLNPTGTLNLGSSTAAVVNNSSYVYFKDSGAVSRRTLGINSGNIFFIGPVDVSVAVATTVSSGSTTTFQVNGSSGAFTTAATFDAAGNFKPNFYTSAAVGSVVASAATITPTGPVFHVSGTTAINTINLPFTGFTGTIRLIADAGWSTTTAGNIGTAIIAVAGQEYDFTYDGSKWYSTSYGVAGGIYNGAPAAPTGTASTSAVMMGLGSAASITPVRTGRISFTISGQMSNTTINDGATVQLRYGTGTAPINGAAVTGTQGGNSQTFKAASAGDTSGFSIGPIIAGLTVGTPYWFDLALQAVTGGTASVAGLTVTAHEI